MYNRLIDDLKSQKLKPKTKKRDMSRKIVEQSDPPEVVVEKTVLPEKSKTMVSLKDKVSRLSKARSLVKKPKKDIKPSNKIIELW